PAGRYRLKVETADAEALLYHYPIEVPEMPARGERLLMAYAVPGADQKSFRVRLETSEGRLLQTSPPVERDPFGILREQEVLYVGLGVAHASLTRAIDPPEERGKNPEAEQEFDRRKFALIEEVALLPDQWFGYAAADAVLLSTRDERFLAQFCDEANRARREALLEWVRRGGVLLLPIGTNRQQVARDLLPQLPGIDLQIAGSEAIKSLPVLSLQWVKLSGQKATLQNLEITKFRAGPAIAELVRESGSPVLLHASLGRGRIFVFAFDLEDPRVTAWEGYRILWNKLQQEIAPLVKRDPKGHAGVLGANLDRDDLVDRLKANLETFEEITPISFGYVALFLVFYILIVGPLDYIILKKIFKRLEWTWLTFPLTILLLSGLAYFVAYHLKGAELRTNKMDLLDFDLHDSGTVYGNTWVTLFSPRVEAYTVGLQPNVVDWFGQPMGGDAALMMQLLEANEPPRTGQQTTFTQPYEFASAAQGMRRVPIPVWGTRSFSASWRLPLGPKPPLGIRDEVGPVRCTNDGRVLVGRLTNQLQGVELVNVGLLYRDRWYDLGNLAPGESVRLEPFFAQDAKVQGKRLVEWFADEALKPGEPLRLSERPLDAQVVHRQLFRLAQEMMFFRVLRSGEKENTQDNASLRFLDQSWRLPPLSQFPPVVPPRYRKEAMVVARTRLVCDQGDRVNRHAINPSRLWLGRLPQDGQPLPVLPGVLTQETFVRFFIPVAN
ncbi:MAG: hypothetical protein SNJ82_09870, partial [Gemmataceae bacterium]